MGLFELGEVDERVKKALAKNQNNPEESRQIFMEEIMDWTDYFTENLISSPPSEEKSVGFNAIVDLWLLCTQFEINLRQYKKAVEVFEQAVNDPVASTSGKVFQAYANFCIERKKVSNAQKVFIRGLTAGLTSSETDSLWTSFLDFMRQNGPAELTLQQLHDSVKSQVGVTNLAPIPVSAITTQPVTKTKDNTATNKSDDMVVVKEERSVSVSDDFYTLPPSTTINTAEDSMEISANESKDTDVTVIKTEDDVHMDNLLAEVDAAHMTTDSTTNPSANAETDLERPPFAVPDSLDRVTGMTPEQIVRTFDRRPLMIFAATNKEPTSFGISRLSDEDTQALDTFLSAPLNALFDSDNHSELRAFEAMTRADKLLDVLESMFSAQGLKERHFDSWMSDLSDLHRKEESDLITTLRHRDILNSLLSEGEIRAKYKIDISRFHSRHAVQKELLNAVVNKTMFALLIEQQSSLAELSFPRFSTQFVDRLEKFVTPQRSVQTASDKKNKDTEFAAIVEHIKSQQMLVCALLSIRLNAVASERNKQQSSHKQAQRTALSRETSVDLGSESQDGTDYYSLEAKKNRKRRRLVDQSAADSSYSHSSVSSGYNNNNSGSSPHGVSSGNRGRGFDEQDSNEGALGYCTNNNNSADTMEVVTADVLLPGVKIEALPLLQKLAGMLQEVKK